MNEKATMSILYRCTGDLENNKPSHEQYFIFRSQGGTPGLDTMEDISNKITCYCDICEKITTHTRVLIL